VEFFLVVICIVEQSEADPELRVITDLGQLKKRPSGSVTLTGGAGRPGLGRQGTPETGRLRCQLGAGTSSAQEADGLVELSRRDPH
jgi:hypothetical protein